MQDMLCMVHYDNNYVTIAGHQDHFYELDMTSGEVYQREVIFYFYLTFYFCTHFTMIPSY